MKTALALVALLACGCAKLVFPADHLAQRNQEGLSCLLVGMPDLDALRCMASRRMLIREDRMGNRMAIGNPYRQSWVRMADGRRAKILYYYTRVEALDDMVSPGELTPVLLRDERVLGWGQDFLEAHADPQGYAQLVARELAEDIETERGQELAQGNTEPVDDEFREAVGRASFLMRMGQMGMGGF